MGSRGDGRCSGRRTTRPSTTTTRASTTTTRTTTTGNGGQRACSAGYTLTNSWGQGFIGEVKVTAAQALSGWRVTLTLLSGTSLANIWNGVHTGTTGAVTVVNAGYNGQLVSGGSTSFGFQGNGSGTGVAVSCAAG